jgi:hypothetical protein
MQRRDFFKAISAAAAALTAGSTALARPAPKVKVSADTTGLVEGIRKSLPEDPLTYVKKALKECRVIRHELSMRAGDWTRCLVTYRHDPNGRRTAEDLRWEQYLADAKMVSVNVSTTVDGSEVEIEHIVDIEYIVPPKRSQA